MREILERICELQSAYSEDNTSAMSERGTLIRNQLPAELDRGRIEFAKAIDRPLADLAFEGRDGTGLKSRVPWVRIYSKALSPKAHIGWYCVYLFRYQGDGVYLALCHASTRWEWFNPRPRPQAEVAALVAWGRKILDAEIVADPQLITPMDLSNTNRLADAYVRSTCISRFYERGDIPSDGELLTDAISFTKQLSKIYHAVQLGLSPDAPEIQAETFQGSVAQIDAGLFASTGQGFGLTAKERKAVEDRAMHLASKELKALGFTKINNTSSKRPFDYEAHLNGKKHLIEVKGTTGNAASIILTRNELDAQRGAWPHNVLIVVDRIGLDRSDPTPVASGGNVRSLLGWQINEQDLKALAYQYVTPLSGWHGS